MISCVGEWSWLPASPDDLGLCRHDCCELRMYRRLRVWDYGL